MRKKKNPSTIAKPITLTAIIVTIIAAGFALQRVNQLQAADQKLSSEPTATITQTSEKRIIKSNGIPNHMVGKFPGLGNSHKISSQNYSFQVPLNPIENPNPQARQTFGRPAGPQPLFGVAINGIPFDPGTAEIWNNDPRFHYEALSGRLANGLGLDTNRAHVQPTGAYHYHGLPTALLESLSYKSNMALVGWAADGYPIYANFGYSIATDPTSPLKKLNSSYRLKSGNRTAGPDGEFDGSFDSDFEFVQGLGDLDEFNGRTGATPEFPKGTYYYVLTETFPFIPRQHKGIPDPSFKKAPPRSPRETTSVPHSHSNSNESSHSHIH